ncbi:MAG: cupin domain-containing protein [Thaumarchaeota archaeon]|nr:cupin domain-containing protein [Nitrososphaerota archaeon]MCL5318576.1 cupin domain-containing protein [Nitrososphaerota archaeon]
MSETSQLTVKKFAPDHVDERGTITNIINNEPVRSITITQSKKGSIRGNHFHKRSGKYVFVLDGKMELVVIANETEVRQTLTAGSMVWIPKNMPHAFLAVEESTALEIEPLNRDLTDAYRLDKPLIQTQKALGGVVSSNVQKSP